MQAYLYGLSESGQGTAVLHLLVAPGIGLPHDGGVARACYNYHNAAVPVGMDPQRWYR